MSVRARRTGNTGKIVPTRSNYEGYTTGFVAEPFTPHVPRGKYNYRIVVCPDCHASVGSPCVNLTTGKPVSGLHVSRKRIALRKIREATD